MAAKIMFGLCCVFFVVGTAGAIKRIAVSARTRKKQKQYTEAKSCKQRKYKR